MTIYSFKNPLFIKTAIKSNQYPILRDLQGDLMPEIAVVGRSNVGKSSLLNHLFQSKGLVKTSSSPGKTQALNFFTLNEQVAFVDLPGYGYAKVSKEVQKGWAPMIESYFQQRDPLSIVLFLFDIRRTPNEEDRHLLNWILHHDKRVILILTKVDKVTLNERNANIRKILSIFDQTALSYIPYSVTKNVGRQQLIHAITDLLLRPS